MVRKIAENGNERARMGLGMGMRKPDTHTMAVALSNYLAKLLGLFFSCFFFFLFLCSSWLQMKRASKTKAHVGYKIARERNLTLPVANFLACFLFQQSAPSPLSACAI